MLKNKNYLLSITLFLSSCAAKKNTNITSKTSAIDVKNVTFSGGDGSSFEKAIIIKAKNSREGIGAEYKYLEQKYGERGVNWQMIMQSLSYKNNKPFDILTIKHQEKEMRVYFEISSFFGKY